ncbi:efflux transporter outer membrane subunit [Mesonia sp. K7]|uniref:efflux transporter outer membrane subunit n=1 Tax=Mesonia sp. K7 TaxID=2218606 RepID=UPI000DA92369|nr:efflux transporter outer membrane subunit [Mesonia sp. K7]PZD79050.1 TolC family protein [Mesonia sp. K7]
MKKNKIYHISLVMISSLLMTSCFVAKDYERPELEEETENLYRTNELPQDSLSMANISYQELFNDAFLKNYIEEGLQNNLDIRVALQNLASAEAYVKQGKVGYLPSLSANGQATHQEFSKNSQFGSIFNGGLTQYELTANLSWEADIWGKIRSQKRAFEASYLQSVAAHQAVKTQLVSSIATTYYQLLALDAQLEVTQQTIATRDSSVTTIKALKDAGQVTQVAVDQNIAQFNNAKALEIDLKAAIFETENALNLLLGRGPMAIERSKLDRQSLNAEIALGYSVSLLSNRPDVMQAEYALVEAFEMTNVSRSNFYPSLTITGSGGFQSLELDELVNVNSLFANIVGGIAQPIFNQRKIRTQHEVAKAQQEQALLNFKKALLVAGNEVSNALYNYKAETEKFEYREEEVKALKRAESNSEELLNNGFANYLDLLTARQSALSAELNMIDNKLQQLLTTVTLYKALGGGWR